MLAGIIFDFDGVIVDSEPLHYESFRSTISRRGVSIGWQDYLENYIGFDDRDLFRHSFQHGGKRLDNSLLRELMEEKAHIFQSLIEREGLQPLPGAIELIRDIHKSLPLALCSGSLRRDIDPILTKLNLGKVFDVVVTAEDVVRSKPDPASYKLALERLQKQSNKSAERDGSDFLAIEDTREGIASAKGAGLHVLAVANDCAKGTGSELKQADWTIDSLRHLDCAKLKELVCEK